MKILLSVNEYLSLSKTAECRTLQCARFYNWSWCCGRLALLASRESSSAFEPEAVQSCPRLHTASLILQFGLLLDLTFCRPAATQCALANAELSKDISFVLHHGGWVGSSLQQWHRRQDGGTASQGFAGHRGCVSCAGVPNGFDVRVFSCGS